MSRKSNPAAGFTPLGATTHHRRKNRPKPDDTLPIFDDLPVLVWCPYGDGHNAERSAFGKNASRPSGLQTYCKACRKLRSAKDRKRSNRKNLVREMRKVGRKIERACDGVIGVIERMMKGVQENRAGERFEWPSVPHGNTDGEC